MKDNKLPNEQLKANMFLKSIDACAIFDTIENVFDTRKQLLSLI